MSESRFNVTVSTGKPTDTRQPQVVTLRIEDAETSACLAHIEMPAEIWWGVCTGDRRTLEGGQDPTVRAALRQLTEERPDA